MKDIHKFLLESKNNELHLAPEYCHFYKAEYIWINTEANVYGFMSEYDIKHWINDFGNEPEVFNRIDIILSLKPGDYYTFNDGNHFFRIKSKHYNL